MFIKKKLTQGATAWLLICLVSACVTINVYFPEAEAEKAADLFIDGVISQEDEDAMVPGTATEAVAWHWSQLLIASAYAQVNIDINTPEVQAIQSRMNARFNGELRAFFDSGAIGFNNQAMIEVRDLGAVSLKDRNKVKKSVAADNRDRDAVYREIAVANGHPEWENQIRQTFAERWIAKAKGGWYYQGSNGSWQQK